MRGITMEELTKAQLKFLRKESHNHKPIFQIGKLGLTDVFIEQIDNALDKRELIKFTILQNSDEDLDEAAKEIAEAVNAYIIQTIGSTAVLYRPSSKEKLRSISNQVKGIK